MTKRRTDGYIKCEMCHERVIKSAPNQRFCGTLKRRIGCSWRARQIYMAKLGRKWRAENAEFDKARKKRWREDNPEKMREYWRNYKHSNPSN